MPLLQPTGLNMALAIRFPYGNLGFCIRREHAHFVRIKLV
jgi:hypothetical protein